MFALERRKVHNNALVSGDGELHVTTPPQCWAYAVSFPPQAGITDVGSISVTVTVSRGQIGVGLLSPDLSHYLVEAFVAAPEQRRSVMLRLPAEGELGPLVIRNADPDGASEATIWAITAGPRLADDSPAGSGEEVRNDAALNLNVPYGSTPRGFQNKNAFADTSRLLGRDAQVVFDVGAHGGEESATYLSLFPAAQIHCFEPAPERAEHLRKMFAGHARVTVHELALANRDGEARFFLNDQDATNSLFPLDPTTEIGSRLQTVGEISVRCATVTSMARALGVTRIDLLKMDAQGAEGAILDGARELLARQAIGLIYLELDFVPVYVQQTRVEDVSLLLRQYGYTLYDFYNFAYAESGQLMWGDAIFLPRSSATAGADSRRP